MRVTSFDQWLVSWSASIACGAPDCPTALKGEEQPYKKDIVPNFLEVINVTLKSRVNVLDENFYKP